MNISYKWLKRYIDMDLTPEQTGEALTSLGLEVAALERVETIRGGLRGLVVGHVLTCIEHPNSDHLHITTVQLAPDAEPVQIVCGAPNVAAGQKVIVATVGTKLYDGDNEFTIKKGKIRGEESLGMICAEDEIGVGTSHDGIIVLPADAPVGQPAAEYYGIDDDWLIEVDLTPNRVDAASHYGVARDLAAWLRQHGKPFTLHRPNATVQGLGSRADEAVNVEVRNTEACPRYSGLTIRNVKVQESPKWLKDLLLAVGQRPINNIVDITNYVLLGLGQPMHCFDLAKVGGNRIVVKTVEAGTPFVTLDGVERTLTERDLMICGAQEQPMCIGGVFGGLDSGVTEQTTDIFLESAYFHPTWIRKSARRFALNTDASFRFERGTDPNATIDALMLAAALVLDLAGGQVCGNVVDVKSRDFPPFPVDLRYDYVTGLIGKDIPHNEIRAIVESLEMQPIDDDGTTLRLLVPTYRVDVQRPCDVVEDILRVYGYNNVELPGTIHTALTVQTSADFSDAMQERVSNLLTANGYREILNNSLTPSAYYDALPGFSADHCVRLMNPLSSDLNVMRQTLLMGGLESIARNLNHKQPNLRFYEFGNVYHFAGGQAAADEPVLNRYSETSCCALWITGNNHDESWADRQRAVNVFDLRADVEKAFTGMGIMATDLVAEPAQTDQDSIFDNSIVYRTRSGQTLAVVGMLADAVLRLADVEQPVCYAEINWPAACRVASKHDIKYGDLPKTLPVRRDLALLVDKNVTYADIRRVVQQCEKRLLRGVNLFDVYESNKLEAGKKSYAVSIMLQDDTKTLQDRQIDAVMQRIIAGLQEQLGAKLR